MSYQDSWLYVEDYILGNDNEDGGGVSGDPGRGCVWFVIVMIVTSVLCLFLNALGIF
jgi:hypothetical protein